MCGTPALIYVKTTAEIWFSGGAEVSRSATRDEAKIVPPFSPSERAPHPLGLIGGVPRLPLSAHWMDQAKSPPTNWRLTVPCCAKVRFGPCLVGILQKSIKILCSKSRAPAVRFSMVFHGLWSSNVPCLSGRIGTNATTHSSPRYAPTRGHDRCRALCGRTGTNQEAWRNGWGEASRENLCGWESD